MGKLSTFLRRNTVEDASPLPYIHTTRSYNVESIKNANAIKSSDCRHFGKDLTYLFVGRPAYKRKPTGSEADYWELPCCFIFESVESSRIERIFPFDSGAFRENLYPDYINFMNEDEFLASPDTQTRIISAFFGSSENYFFGKAKSKDSFDNEFQLGVFDAELKALRRLAEDGTPSNFDDRRFTVEVQMQGAIDFAEYPPQAVILPSIYLRDEGVRNKILDDWKAEPLTYEMYGLSQDKYDAIIYSKVEEFYRSRGYI
jgi:hypothetical protein